MIQRLLGILGMGGESRESRAPADLVTLERGQVEPFIALQDDLPRIDWGAVDTWIERTETDPRRRQAVRRGAAAVWLDGVRDALEADHRRWRHARVEGLGPVADQMAVLISRRADVALVSIERALKPVRGDEPVPPLAIVGLDGSESYYTFVSYYYPDEGEWGTSGGVYLNEGEGCFPVIAFPTKVKHGIDQTIAHELTHHALHGLGLPLWVEEGFTQMMEERVTGLPNFKLDREMMGRQREKWVEGDLERFVAGECFSSAHDDEQELAYHLSQLVVRGWLTREPARFFAFARACREVCSDTAAREQLGGTEVEVVEAAIRRCG